jgi:hypothetical protein
MSEKPNRPDEGLIIALFKVVDGRRQSTDLAYCYARAAFIQKDTVNLLRSRELAKAMINEHGLHKKYDVEIVENRF